jgi:pyruvate dehydrogenase E2 component (dihydrolipoamide acetyltransferase)
MPRRLLLAMAPAAALALVVVVAVAGSGAAGAAAAPLPVTAGPRRALLQRDRAAPPAAAAPRPAGGAPAAAPASGLCPCGVLDSFPQGVVCRVCVTPQDPALTLKPGDSVPCRCGVASSAPAAGGAFNVVCRTCGPNDTLDFSKPLPVLAPNGTAVAAGGGAGKPAAAPAAPAASAAGTQRGGGLAPQPRPIPPIAAPAVMPRAVGGAQPAATRGTPAGMPAPAVVLQGN